jgi:urea transporter
MNFLNVLLRGAGQVMFQDNPITGLLFLLGVSWAAFAAGTPAVAAGAVVGLVVSTVTARWLQVDLDSLKSGLYGYNGILVGAALPTFLTNDYPLWFLVCVGGICSTVTFMATANILKTWEGPALTFPFVLVTWALLLAAYQLSSIPIGSMAPPGLPEHVTAESTAHIRSVTFWWEALCTGVSQVFLCGNPITGVIFVVGLAVSSRWAAGLAVYGSFLAVVTALFLGADPTTVQNGLYGFSPVLTAIALGCTFYKPTSRVLIFTTVATVSTVLAQAALDVAVMPFGIVSLTAPFVFTTWVFLLAKGNLAPLPHDTVTQSAFGDHGTVS